MNCIVEADYLEKERNGLKCWKKKPDGGWMINKNDEGWIDTVTTPDFSRVRKTELKKFKQEQLTTSPRRVQDKIDWMEEQTQPALDLTDSGYGMIPRDWSGQNQYINNMDLRERLIYETLVKYVWRDADYQGPEPVYKEISRIYRNNKVLATKMGQRGISERCVYRGEKNQNKNISRVKVMETLERFEADGAVITRTHKKRDASLYILGIQIPNDQGGLVNRYFVDSPILQQGGRIPEEVIRFIVKNFSSKEPGVLLSTVLPSYDLTIPVLLFSSSSPLVPKTTEGALNMDFYRSREGGGSLW
jgi:hypothetical protein